MGLIQSCFTHSSSDNNEIYTLRMTSHQTFGKISFCCYEKEKNLYNVHSFLIFNYPLKYNNKILHLRCSSSINQRSSTAFTGIIPSLKNPISFVFFILYSQTGPISHLAAVHGPLLNLLQSLFVQPSTLVLWPMQSSVILKLAVAQLKPKYIIIKTKTE